MIVLFEFYYLLLCICLIVSCIVSSLLLCSHRIFGLSLYFDSGPDFQVHQLVVGIESCDCSHISNVCF